MYVWMTNEKGEITLIPSVHYSPTHYQRVVETIRDEEPDVVGIELGTYRYRRLDSGDDIEPEDIASEIPGMAGRIYLAFSKLQQRMADNNPSLDVQTIDMEAGVRTAAELDTSVALIDDDVTETITDLSENVSLMDIPKFYRRAKELDEEDVAKVQEAQKEMMENMGSIESGDDIDDLTAHMRKIAPEVTEIMIDQRDRSMAHRLHKISENGHDVVAVIGAGHHNGILEHLERLENGEEEVGDYDVPIREPQMNVTNVTIN